ncbi:MAG: hypothetical protein WCT03_27315 [Candidatus Obscuribacterales bacterium]
METHSIAGEWRGHYDYDEISGHGADFTVHFSDIEGRLAGTVLDNSPAGKATITGTFSFPQIQFEKVYLEASEAVIVNEEKNSVPFKIFGIELPIRRQILTKTMYKGVFGLPIRYEGSMSDDGMILNGIWSLTNHNGLATTGKWSANRMNKQENET